jgi:hypothetical protein
MKSSSFGFAGLAGIACLGFASAALAQQLLFQQLPAPVQATVQREIQGGTLGEIEREERAGVVTYEVEYVLGGTQYELDIAEDGRLLRRKLD